MKKAKSWMSVLLALLILLLETLPITTVSATQVSEAVVETQEPSETATEPEEPAEAVSSAVAPKDYQPTATAPQIAKRDGGQGQSKVLLIQDTLPWDSDANSVVLNSLGYPYDIVSTTDFVTNVDLAQYMVVIIANDQGYGTYENYKQFKEYLEIYTELGGVIVFGACDAGWANGNLTEYLPGDIQKANEYVYNNYIADDHHPIVTCELSDGVPLVNDDLYNYYCSHTYFLEETLPAGSRVILRDSDGSRPTLVEYPLGNGRVIASGLTWEHAYYQIGGYAHDFAVKAMDDLFLYAIRVSNMTVTDMERLEEYRVNALAHQIIVGDKYGKPLEGAMVSAEVEGKKVELETDERGVALLKEYGIATVTISKNGYQTKKFIYPSKKSTAKLFFLLEEETLKLPYVTMAEEMTNYTDLMCQKLFFDKGSDASVNFRVEAEWYGKTPAEYLIYQTDEKGNTVSSITSTDGSFSFKPGQKLQPEFGVALRVFATDGTASKSIALGLVVHEPASIQPGNPNNGSNLDNMTDFKLFEDMNASLSDSNATQVLPSNWSVSIEAFPVEIKKSYDSDDGTTTYRATIGIADYEFADDLLDEKDGEGKWETFVSQIKEAKKLYGSRKELIKKYKDKLKHSKFNSQFGFEVEVLGYFEVKVNAFGEVVKYSGGFLISAEAGHTIGGTVTAPIIPIPVYYEIEFKVKLDAELGLAYTIVDETGSFSFEGNIKLTVPDITIGGGVGVYGIAQVGVEGNGGLEMEIAPNWSGKLKASASIKVKVLFLGEWKWQIGSGWEHQLWPKAKTATADLTAEDATIRLSSNEFRKKTTRWYGYSELLQDWVLPGTMPELIRANGDTLLLFQVAYGENSVKLYYSRYENGGWSEPQPVSYDETADTYFRVASYGDDILVVWQNVDGEINFEDAETAMQDMASKSEILVASWNTDTKCFDEPVKLTENDTLDMIPRIYMDADGAVAAWVNNTGNELLGGDGTNIIYSRTYADGMWQEAKQEAVLNSYVSDLAIGRSTLGYINEGKLFTREQGQTALSSESIIPDGLACYDDCLYWTENGRLFAYQGGQTEEVIGENISVAANYRLLRSDARTMLVWLNGQQVLISLRDENGWSNALTIYNFDEEYTPVFFDAELDENDALLLTADVESEEGERTSIVFTLIEPSRDIAIDYVYADCMQAENGKQPITVHLCNKGDLPLHSFAISVYDEDYTYHQEEVACNIAPGGEIDYEAVVDISTQNATELEVWVDTEGDSDDSNNYDTVEVNKTDVSLDVEYYYLENRVLVSATVKNLSDAIAHATISVLEDSETGIILDMKNLGTLKRGEEVIYLYEFVPDEIEFGETKAKNYVFKMDCLEKEYNSENNVCYVVIYNPEAKEAPLVLQNPFVDVKKSKYFYKPVLWAYYHDPQITNGTDATHFSPNDTCTRAQVVTFLWAAKGKPEADWSNNPFKDVKKSKYYFKPVLWAFQNGITNGVDDTHFQPNGGCTRAQVVTFLWALSGKPNPAEGSNPFKDVKKSNWYYKAVLWAYQNGITRGVDDTHFGPNQTCTRGQVVTFLYALLGK